jgi:hypothetical protein
VTVHLVFILNCTSSHLGELRIRGIAQSQNMLLQLVIFQAGCLLRFRSRLLGKRTSLFRWLGFKFPFPFKLNFVLMICFSLVEHFFEDILGLIFCQSFFFKNKPWPLHQHQ